MPWGIAGGQEESAHEKDRYYTVFDSLSDELELWPDTPKELKADLKNEPSIRNNLVKVSLLCV